MGSSFLVMYFWQSSNFTASCWKIQRTHDNPLFDLWHHNTDIKQIVLCPVSRQICINYQWPYDPFGFFSWKFKWQKILRNRILFPDFTSCCWLSENARWPLIALWTMHMSLQTKEISFLSVTKIWGELWLNKTLSSFSSQLIPNFWDG